MIIKPLLGNIPSLISLHQPLCKCLHLQLLLLCLLCLCPCSPVEQQEMSESVKQQWRLVCAVSLSLCNVDSQYHTMNWPVSSSLLVSLSDLVRQHWTLTLPLSSLSLSLSNLNNGWLPFNMDSIQHLTFDIIKQWMEWPSSSLLVSRPPCPQSLNDVPLQRLS